MNVFSFVLTQLRHFFQQFAKTRYVVYHNANPLAFLYPEAYSAGWFSSRAKHFTMVAIIAAPLDRIFLLSNHSENRDWTTHREVRWSAPDPRSTSVGDIIASEDGRQAWLVMPVGFKELGELPLQEQMAAPPAMTARFDAQ